MSVFYDYQKAYEAKDLQTMRLLAKKMTTIIEDLDKVVGTQSCFLTGKWIKDARAWGKDPMEKLYYELLLSGKTQKSIKILPEAP